MKFAVLYSKKDEAGKNIADCLSRYFLPHVPVIELDKESIYNENADEKIPEIRYTDFIIFATKHQSKEGKPSLSLHAPGNWRGADFGGKMGKICKTSALALKFLFQKLNDNAKSMMPELEHNITLEVTHHGPLLEKVPSCFIEIGSSIENWQNKKLGEIIAKTISDFQDFKPDRKIKTALGIGGPHYCPNFNKIQLNNNEIAIGHIIPEYALPLNENMIKEAISKTKEHLDLVLLDWKGCGNSESRQKVIELIEKSGLAHERTERIEK
jgi:D-aminoacyl-tRNA deacylase